MESEVVQQQNVPFQEQTYYPQENSNQQRPIPGSQPQVNPNYQQQNSLFSLTNQQEFMEPEKKTKTTEKVPTIEDKIISLQVDIRKLQNENIELNEQLKEAMNDYKSIQNFVTLNDKKKDLQFYNELLAKTRREYSEQKFSALKNEVQQITKDFKDISQVNSKLQMDIWTTSQKIQELQKSEKNQQYDYLNDQLNQYEKYYNDLKIQEQQLLERSCYIITSETLHSLNEVNTKITPLKKRLANLQKQKAEQKSLLAKLKKQKEEEKRMSDYQTQQVAREKAEKAAKQEQYNKILNNSNGYHAPPRSPRRLNIQPINPALYVSNGKTMDPQ